MKRLQLPDYGRQISSITQIPEIVNFARYRCRGVEFFFMISGYVIFSQRKIAAPASLPCRN